MRCFYVSEMDRKADELARKYGIGLETIDFCRPENMENDDVVRAKQQQFEGIAPLSLHAPYYELFPSAIDPMIRSVAMHRFTQSLKTCEKLGINRIIVHSGFHPNIYYPQWFVPKSIVFWKEFAAGLPDGFELVIENVLDTSPEFLRDICDGIDDPRIRICLDVGHANAYSDIPAEEWVRVLGVRIAHVHLHNNSGDVDAHQSLENGSMDMETVLKELDMYAPEAAVCIESMDAAACLRWLKERRFIDV